VSASWGRGGRGRVWVSGSGVSESWERDGSRPSRVDIGRLLRSNMASLAVEARPGSLKHQ
jgi:hypothetical protein